MTFKTLFGWRLWLALALGLSISQVGCDKLGFGDKKKDSKSKKDKDSDDEDEDEDDKKKKKDKAASSSSATAADSAKPADTSTSTAGGDSTGIPECDLYLESYKKCIPGATDENVKTMRDAYKAGAAGPAKDQLAKSCKDSIETIKKVCPGKLP